MAKDLTQGKVLPTLVGFTLPLILSNLFQLTYNAVDSIIVGQFVGDDALSAVGICNPVITLLVLFLNGLCLGASILMGTQYGAKQFEKLRRQISTTMLAGVAFALFLSVLCIALARLILRLIQVDDAILDLTTGYLRVVLIGLPFTYLYNFFASTIRALGDSRTPLYFLIFSSIFNILGDLFFVLVLNMGSVGCAIATVISQGISVLLCAVWIRFRIPLLRLGRGWFVFDTELLGKTVAYGWVTAMQQATIQLGKLGIQTIVNTMSGTVVTAFSAVNRVDDFVYTPQQNIGHAMMGMMAQNRGAGRRDRVKRTFRYGMLLEVIYGVAVCVIFFILARPIIGLFTDSEDVIEEGVLYLHIIAAMYILPACTNGIQGYFRGIGDLRITLISSFVNMGVRVLAAIPLVFVFHLGMEALPFAYLAGWIAMLATETPLLIRNYRRGFADVK